tara:strand:+ start:1470 stop:1868 length:399 start_codon:yes stop_codon:yes gene_type:complete
MIQRIQSLLFLLSSLISLSVVFYFPILSNDTGDLYLHDSDSLIYLRFLIFFSVFLSLFAIFQFQNRLRQRFISSLSRLMITIFYIVILLFFREDNSLEIGVFLFIIPFVLLFLASFFIKKDDKLVRDSDRIR